MHEYSIVAALIERATAEAREHGARAVHRLEVSIGEQAGVEPELLARAYQTFRERTACEGADLVVSTVPARWVCPRCGGEVPRGGPLRCARCDQPARMQSGDEITLDRIELEIGDV